MPITRMRMRPWLEKMIESDSISGLTWIDEDKKMFSIPWKHAARHGWEMDKDACLFKKWAIHTGKYAEGQTCDPKTWKANFRCAMNSLPDIEEVKDRSVNKGHQAMRIFRMLPSSPKSRDKRSKAKKGSLRKKNSIIKMEEDSDYSDTRSPSATSLPDQSPFQSPFHQDSTVDSTVDNAVRVEPQDFPYVPTSEVPDWSLTVDINSETDFCRRLQVSPDRYSDQDAENDIIEICRMLEKEDWTQSQVDYMGFLSNESSTSPQSLWSDSSSDDGDELPRYTLLGTNSQGQTEDIWNSICLQSSRGLRTDV